MKHRGDSAIRVWWRQFWCSLRHAGGHPLDCGYARDCQGDHRCTACGWTGR